MVCCLGLRLCHWSGRSQIIKHQSVTYFLDGAHTPASMKVLLYLICALYEGGLIVSNYR